jgi:hypothetical protein
VGGGEFWWWSALLAAGCGATMNRRTSFYQAVERARNHVTPQRGPHDVRALLIHKSGPRGTTSEPVMFQVWRWNKITDFVPKLLDFEITVNLTVDFVPNG